MNQLAVKQYELYIDTREYTRKPTQSEVSGRINNEITKSKVKLTPDRIADEVGNKGRTMLPALMKGGRSNKNFVEQYVYAIDFDNDTHLLNDEGKKVRGSDGKFIKVKTEGEKYDSLEDIFNHEFIQSNASFAYKTFSYTEEWERFRIVFFLNRPLVTADEVTRFHECLSTKFKNIDPSAKDPARIFYGGIEAIEIDYQNVLNVDDVFAEEDDTEQETFSFTIEKPIAQNITDKFDEEVKRYIELDEDNLLDESNWVSILYSLVNSIYQGELTQGQAERYCAWLALGDKEWAYSNVQRLRDELDRKTIPDSKWTFASKVRAVIEPKEKTEKIGNVHDLAKKTMFCSWDDTGNAERFELLFGKEFLYNTTAKEWYVFDEKVWKPDDTLLAEVCATQVSEVMKHEPINAPPKDLAKIKEAKDRFIKSSRNHNNKMNMLRSARSLLPITEDSFDQNGNVINLQNGYFDLDNKEFKEHDSKKYFTLISNASYDPNANCPLWIKFINESFLGDVELIEYVQRAVGYSISNSTTERLIFFLYGKETGTGKSVFTNILDDLLGTYSQNIKPEALMVDKNKTGDSADPSFAKLKGARLVTTSESNESGKIDEGLIKRVTGGDKITARFLHKNEITYTPEFKIWMATNYKPIVQNNDSALSLIHI